MCLPNIFLERLRQLFDFKNDFSDVTFIRHDQKQCTDAGHQVGSLEECKRTCANDNNCGACEEDTWGDVHLKGSPCTLQSFSAVTAYVKTVV